MTQTETPAELLQHAAEHLRANRVDAAVQLCRRVLEIQPEEADAHHCLGVCAVRTGNIEDALASIRRAIQIRPGKAEYHNSLGNAFLTNKQAAHGIHHFWQAIALEPEYVVALSNLANALRRIGYTEEAERIDLRRIAVDPRNEPDFRRVFRSGRNAQQCGEYAKAVTCYRRAIELAPDFFAAHQYLGQTLWLEGRIDEAIEVVEHSLTVKPDHMETQKNLAVLYMETNRVEATVEVSRRIVQLAPDYALGYLALAHSKRFSADDPDLALIEAAPWRNSIDAAGRIILDFALGKVYEDLGDYAKSFEHYLRGNQAHRRTIQYDPRKTTDSINAQIEFFTPARFTELGDRFADDSELPVFIVGMPRSGTTLTEQILASHRSVYGGGELLHVRTIKERIEGLAPNGQPFPQCLLALAPSTGRKLAIEHIDALARMGRGALRVTDKMPGNFFYIGLIRLFWPNARIIHCVRDPMDTCLSCYTRHFASPQFFAWDLAELGRYYRNYQRLMNHWREVLPGNAEMMFELNYERLIENPEQVSRELVAFCGLPWDEACLKFYESDRPVRTNRLAVRRPVNNASVGRWRRYEAYLEPLRRALTGDSD